ncbi:MAG: hypothetical protein GF364_05935 [Candidatus Lokiarchaeota archaeon]|nr:hypothetical protein [Candidatus Lokiarchaeota archaeon]
MRKYDKKIQYAMELIKKGLTYREIQDELHAKFNSSISNSTIKKLHRKIEEEYSKDAEIARLKKELKVFKDLYFELLEKVDELESKNKNHS